MIVSASRRTDVPAFYAPWLMARVREGFCEVANPYRRAQRTVVSLRPEDVDCFVFWTRAPAGLLERIGELCERGLRWYFQFTVLDYPRSFEPGSPPLDRRLELFARAAEATPRGGVVWRYDPVILSSATPPAFHVERFGRLAERLQGLADRVVVSLLDVYRRAGRGLGELERDGVRIASPEVHEAAARALLGELAGLARARGMEVRSCAEPADWLPAGVKPGKCVDDELIRRLYGIEVTGAKDPGQRRACGCVASRDIGAYDTCLHGCRYCYATGTAGRAADAFRRHTVEDRALG